LRPLELRLAHFGPYRDEAVLDFEALDRLFLVCGPTGAGKTTLFDALTFALYERTPGTRGELADQLASHHAPAGSVPRVSLRFSMGPQQWRVTRHLKHRVLKQRGEGWREQEAQVLLERKKDEAWEPVPGKRSEINRKLEDLIGLSAEEFSKIVVLPQGDFQRFLEASSNEREKMLQKLFPVEAYERMVETLKLRARTVEETRRRWEDKWNELQAKLGPGAGDRSALEAAWAEADAQVRSAVQAETDASEVLTRLKGQWDDWRTLLSLRRKRSELDAGRPQFETDLARVGRARLARPLGADLDRQESIKAEGQRLRATQESARQELVPVEASLAVLEAGAAEAAARESRLAEVLKQRGILEHQQTLWTEARTLETSEIQARDEEKTVETAYRLAREARQKAEQALPPQPPGPGWDEALALLDAARLKDQTARTEAENRSRRSTLEAERDRSVRDESAAEHSLAACDGEVVLWTQVVSALKAADLAQTLQPDLPCPVCGSLEHPHPAAWPEASAQAPHRLEAALSSQSEARKLLAVARDRRSGLVDRLAELPLPGEDVPKPAEAATLLSQAQSQVDALKAWTSEQTAARKQVEETTAQETKTREAWQAALTVREAWTSRRQALSETVPSDPAPLLEGLRKEEDELRRRLDDDQRRTETLSRTRQTLRTRIDEWEKQLKDQREDYRRLQTSLETAVGALGWTVDDLKAARLEEAALRTLEEGLEAFTAQEQRLAGELASLEGKFAGGEPSALEPAAESLELRRQERASFEAQAKEKEFALRDRDRVEDELREVVRQKGALEADFQRLVPLSQTLDGRNRLNLKLTTWVLIQALEQVAQSATHRLAAMSGGRYALKVQTQGLDGRKDWGLDLSVIDGYTGQERAVGTLSGGEKFMTSISLALGLADVIQERAGGLKLEAVFIDEGFGTLDDQSLDRAMAILHDLGQHRSVGIISHVAELRQRISSRVEVVKGKNGSTLKTG
jgi:exonuclease SbcC